MAININKLNVDNIIFDNVKNHSSVRDFHYQRIPIKYLNERGTPVELCIAMPELMTYGIQANRPRN